MKEKLIALLATQGDERPNFEVICAAYAGVHKIKYVKYKDGQKHEVGTLHRYVMQILFDKYIMKALPLSDFIIGDYYRWKEWDHKWDHKWDSKAIKPLAIGGLIEHERLNYEQAVTFIKILYNEKYGEKLEENICTEVLNDLMERNLGLLKGLKLRVKDAKESLDQVRERLNSKPHMKDYAAVGVALSYYYLSFKIKPAIFNPIYALGTAGIIINLGIGAVFAGAAALAGSYFATHYLVKQSPEDTEKTPGL